MEALPAKTIHVALYLTKLTQEADSAAPVSAAVYAIAVRHQVSGWAEPLSLHNSCEQTYHNLKASPTYFLWLSPFSPHCPYSCTPQPCTP